jgi:CRISPR-associated endonuclease/helicase Cas3
MLCARVTEDGRKQLLSTHLDSVAKFSSQAASVIGLANTGRCVGLFHDLGKNTQAFQDYLKSDEKDYRGSVIHSVQGAKLLYEHAYTSGSSLIAEILANCILGHHGTLSDGVSPNGISILENKFSEDNLRLFYTEFLSKYKEVHPATSDISALLEACQSELRELIDRCKKDQLDTAFVVQMVVRFLYSCLVDADRYDAYCFDVGISKSITLNSPWHTLFLHLEKYLVEKNANTNDDAIQRIRQTISGNCLEAAERPKGILQLSVPTGGGKTLSSLRFAVSHAKKHQMDRIIIVIPYLSVLEQTADEIRKALSLNIDDTILLEHHSNLIPPEDDELAKKQKMLTERWDAPIIVTTMVQFLESIYSHKGGKLRKFHHMANSVIIFDEVQSLPLKCVHLFNQAINFLTIFGGSTALLCTATQPLLDQVKRPILLSASPSLVQNMQSAFSVLARTRIVPCFTNHGGISTDELL